jgi:protein dispatched 1
VTEETETSDAYVLPPIFVKRTFLTLGSRKREEKKIKENETEAQIERKSFIRKTCGVDLINYELNPYYVRLAPLSDTQMMRAMGGTMRHAASSIFVTSFTTAAAFLTNYITRLPYVQLFGIFTGLCILIYFLMCITLVASFVVSYEKYLQHFYCHYREPKFMKKIKRQFDRFMSFLALLNQRVVSQMLPAVIIKCRFLFVVIFTIIGIAGMVTVFHKPKLKPPSTWRYRFFEEGNLLENFEFILRDQFPVYINAEKRNFTNPDVFFVFGIGDKDNGRVFNPDDSGFLVFDQQFDLLDSQTQLWLNNFINTSIASRPDLFLVDEIVEEWSNYLYSMQQYCYGEMGLPPNEIFTKLHLPYNRDGLVKCRNEIRSMLYNSSIYNFESLMASFPRRIIFLSDGTNVKALLLRVNANRSFLHFEIVRDYYNELKEFHTEQFETAPPGMKSGWFISTAFALYDIQYQLISGTYSSLTASMAIALIILLLTSGNLFISIYSIITITFTIADTVAVFVWLGWELNVLESVIIIMSVGLSVDFSCHYGVAYIKSEVEVKKVDDSNDTTTSPPPSFLRKHFNRYKNGNHERFARINDIFLRVGSAVSMAAFTTFLAGFSMYPSILVSFSKMGQFLMLVMCISYLFATFYFVPLCAIFGPTNNFGDLKFKFCAEFLMEKVTFFVVLINFYE